MTHESRNPQGFGTFKGVFVPSILTILGVIMYLRLGWVVGNAGLLGTILIVTLGSAITFLTGLSIAATATNMKVGGGGAYYMVSRSFGIELGASIGLPLYLAQALGISFYIAGFAESVAMIAPFLPVTIVGLIALAGLGVLAYGSADLALKAQYVILAVILASLVSLVLGSPLDLSALPLLEQPVTPPQSPSFWQIFAVFFPAVTGIEAGISMSGDLKNPRRSLPLGTIAAVIVGYAVYMSIPIVLSQRVPGDILRTDSMIFQKVSLFGPLFFLGVWGATLSSGLGALLGGPRTLQAMAQDRVVPVFLGRVYGKTRNPRIATAITLAIAAGGLLIGNLDAIAPILSMFFLTSYCALNLISGLEGMVGNPSWRPSFRIPWSISLLGALACFGVMMMIDPGASFLAVFCVLGIYYVMRRRRMQVGWSDIRGGLMRYLARMSIYRLMRYGQYARSWRPNMVVLSGSPATRWFLIELADAITQGKGFLTIASIVNKTGNSGERSIEFEKSVRSFLHKHQVPALVRVKPAASFTSGAIELIENYGLGPIVPNTILLGDTTKPDRVIEVCKVIQATHAAGKNILIARNMRQGSMSSKLAKKRRIDVWWRRKQNNASLMLTLAYMLQTSPEWRGADLVLKSLTNGPQEQKGISDSLKAFVKESRIDAHVDVYVADPAEQPFELIRRLSEDTDLMFLGLAPPSSSADDYVQIYTDMIERTSNFPPTLLTLAGENLSLKDIFV